VTSLCVPGSCVRGLEHHSTFLNNCCGAHNRRSFLLSLSSVMLVALMSSALAAYEIIGEPCIRVQCM